MFSGAGEKIGGGEGQIFGDKGLRGKDLSEEKGEDLRGGRPWGKGSEQGKGGKISGRKDRRSAEKRPQGGKGRNDLNGGGERP